MKTKLLLGLALGLLVAMTFLCAGCGQKAAALPDRFYIAEAALRYMLDQDSSSSTSRDYYSAYVIDGGEFTPELVKAFSGYKPTVTADIQVSTEKGVAIDKATGKHVKLWSVKIREINGSHATAYVSYYVGSEEAGGFTIHLQRSNGKWIVESQKMDWVS